MEDYRIVNSKISPDDWVKFKKKLIDDKSNANKFIREKISEYINPKNKQHASK